MSKISQFGSDENSLALLEQWSTAKKLRDPAVVKKMAEDRGLHFAVTHLLGGPPQYRVDRGGACLVEGPLEVVAKFVSDYTVVSVLAL